MNYLHFLTVTVDGRYFDIGSFYYSPKQTAYIHFLLHLLIFMKEKALKQLLDQK